MPGVAVLPPPSPRLAGFGPDTHNGTYLPRQSINSSVDSPAMQNGSSSLGTVSEIKTRAKNLAEQTSKGIGARALIGSARSQIQRGQLEDTAGHPKAALYAFHIAANLAKKSMDIDKIKGGASDEGNKSIVQFFEENRTSLNRIKTLEAELLVLERSTAAESPHQDERPNVKVGTLVADRLKMLGQNGVIDPVTKRYSRELPTVITPSAFLPDTARPNRPPALLSSTPVLSTASSASSSATTSPHAVVPPSSLGPPSPTSSDSSSPRLSYFAPSISEVAHNFPSIDELNEMDSTYFRQPSLPRVHPTGSSISSRRSSISRSQSNGTGEHPTLSSMRSFPVLSIDPGPRPSSTPITPITNSFISHPGSPLPKPPLGPSPLPPTLMHPIPEYAMPSPFIEKKALPSMPSMLAIEKRIPSEKPAIQRSTTVSPKDLHNYIHHGVTTLIIDIRTREAFEKEHIRGDPVICLEPSVIMRSSLDVKALEDLLSVGDATLFKNRDKFDIVVFYDDSSETLGNGPLSKFVTIVYEQSFTTVLRNPPMLLLGGLKAWREEMGVDHVKFAAGGGAGVNGGDIQSAETKSGGPSASQSASRFWTPPAVNGALPGTPASSERRFPEIRNDSSVPPLRPDPVTVSDTRTSMSHRNAPAHTSSSISYSHSHSDSTPHTPPVIAHSLVNGPAPIQYPIFSNTSTSSASRPGGTPLLSQPPTLPPQASINPSPLVRRRSDYLESDTSAGSFSSRRPIGYPDLLPNSHVLRPPPPAASNSFQRQHSHSQSYSVSTLKEPPKPPTIPSTYPVTYWSDMQIVTAGLKNLGNTCYMNATIQCLTATVPFARFFTDGRWKAAVNAINPMGTKGQLASAFATILYEMSHSELPHLNPTMFRKSICTHAPQFSGSDQHDSQEFLTFLLDGLHEDLNRVLQRPSNGSTPEREAELERLPQSIASTQEWEIYRMRNDSLIVDFFQGQFRNRMECLTCHKTSTTYNSFMYLSLPMPSLKGPSKTSLQSCLDAFVKEEVLAGSEAWHCPHCKTLRRATKQLSLSRLPPILLIHLKRFSHKGMFTDKIETVVDFPLKGLDLTNYMPPAPPPGVAPVNGMGTDDPRVQMPPYKYDLYGVTNHFGSLSNGHYTAFIASRGGWVYCDDSRVTPTDAKEVVGRPAYVLYYKRIKS
ncbi:cysteine proteinase [Rhizopogon vinicolor AM-OR11-026]|uniref:ubiquitinyl hydrolase 1 n=1 Tax=Rhizopogon vinicolor AM-OR11-026 TaxID=1314800 RepID=A0A1B7N649_9AGAM|nr:cysteine proteinase [Rhizopogon vinicolor AM-OR11-026]